MDRAHCFNAGRRGLAGTHTSTVPPLLARWALNFFASGFEGRAPAGREPVLDGLRGCAIRSPGFQTRCSGAKDRARRRGPRRGGSRSLTPWETARSGARASRPGVPARKTAPGGAGSDGAEAGQVRPDNPCRRAFHSRTSARRALVCELGRRLAFPAPLPPARRSTPLMGPSSRPRTSAMQAP